MASSFWTHEARSRSRPLSASVRCRGHAVEDAEGADPVPARCLQRLAGVEADGRVPGHEGLVGTRSSASVSSMTSISGWRIV